MADNRYSSKELASRVLTALGGSKDSTTHTPGFDYLCSKLAEMFDESYGQAVLPTPSESCVVALDNPRTAALFFDRVWTPFPGRWLPQDIEFYGGTELEVWNSVLVSALSVHGEMKDHLETMDLSSFFQNSPISEALGTIDGDDVGSWGMARLLASAIKTKHGLGVLPMYSSDAERISAYSMGDRRTLLAVVDNLEVIDESHLSLEQVSHIRSDKEAAAKLRAFRHWVDSNFEGKPLDFVIDAVGIRYEEYRKSVRKHGVKTIIGSMKSLLDPTFIGSAAVIGSAVGAHYGALFGLGGAAVSIVGKTVLSVVENFNDLSDAQKGPGAEVAFVYELEKDRPKQ